MKTLDILVRGGEKIPLVIKANVVIPDVYIVQNDFKFGTISFNEKSVLNLTFKNRSKLSARIIVNFTYSNLRDFKVIISININIDSSCFTL